VSAQPPANKTAGQTEKKPCHFGVVSCKVSVSSIFFSSYETTLPDFDGLVKIPYFVMPDLIRYPEYAEITGFRPSPE
jgi:hypothetical protein